MMIQQHAVWQLWFPNDLALVSWTNFRSCTWAGSSQNQGVSSPVDTVPKSQKTIELECCKNQDVIIRPYRPRKTGLRKPIAYNHLVALWNKDTTDRRKSAAVLDALNRTGHCRVRKSCVVTLKQTVWGNNHSHHMNHMFPQESSRKCHTIHGHTIITANDISTQTHNRITLNMYMLPERWFPHIISS